MMSSQMYLTPLDVLKHFEKIWTNEKEVLSIYLATLRSPNQSITHVHNNPISLFFFEVLPVLPSKFRPVCWIILKKLTSNLFVFFLKVLSFNDQKFENPKTVRYSSIIQDNQLIKELLLLKDKQTSDVPTTNTVRFSFVKRDLKGVYRGRDLHSLPSPHIYRPWQTLSNRLEWSSVTDRSDRERHFSKASSLLQVP
jgi:hypothetical protein